MINKKYEYKPIVTFSKIQLARPPSPEKRRAAGDYNITFGGCQ